MNLRLLCTSAAIVFGTLLLASTAQAQTRPAAPESPYGGTTVEEIVARINDRIITRSDYDRAMKEMDGEMRQKGASMQDISAAHRDLLSSQIDQQLWLSKGKDLGITGETELVNRLNEIRKQYNLESIEDLEKEARNQGVSFEDFKANIRNRIITEQVMRQEVGRKIAFTSGEAERYFEAHKQNYVQPESVVLSEILVSIGTPTPSATAPGGVEPDDPVKLAAAKAKADDIEARLHAGGDFAQLARSFSDGPTAASGGDLGQYQRGSLAKVLEDTTFALKAGEYTEPIRTKQGYAIFKVVKHNSGGVPAYKDVQNQVEEAFYMSRMEPAIREYLNQMRNEAYINIKPGYEDTGATAAERNSSISFSAYVPPTPKKKQKVQRTRFRETPRTFRQKTRESAAEAAPQQASAPAAEKKGKKKGEAEAVNLATMKPAKREKIRYGKAPSQTLPEAANGKVEDAGAGPQQAAAAQEPENPLEEQAATRKTRFADRAKVAKASKAQKPKDQGVETAAPDAPAAAEVADRQAQSTPLGLGGDTANKQKKKVTTTGNKTRMTKKKKEEPADVPLANAPATAPAPSAQPPATTPAPAPASNPQNN